MLLNRNYIQGQDPRKLVIMLQKYNFFYTQGLLMRNGKNVLRSSNIFF